MFNSEEHYGDLFCVYNVHNLIHICDDVRYYNVSLDKISAFPFENFLQTLKRYVRGKQNPLVQICKRLGELEGLVVKEKVLKSNVGKGKKNCCLLADSGIVFIKSKRSDGRFLCDMIHYRDTSDFFSDFIDSKKIGIYFLPNNVPSTICFLEMKQLHNKCVCLPYKEGRVVMKLLH